MRRRMMRCHTETKTNDAPPADFMRDLIYIYYFLPTTISAAQNSVNGIPQTRVGEWRGRRLFTQTTI
jgi:hypothetical protein